MQAVLVLFMRQFLAKELEALLFFSPINPQRAKALLSDTIWVAESANRVPSSEWSLGNEVFHTKVLHEPWGFSPFRGLLFSLWILWLIDPSFCPRNREISRVHRGREMVEWCTWEIYYPFSISLFASIPMQGASSHFRPAYFFQKNGLKSSCIGIFPANMGHFSRISGVHIPTKKPPKEGISLDQAYMSFAKYFCWEDDHIIFPEYQDR